jgi:hypothetical protein
MLARLVVLVIATVATWKERRRTQVLRSMHRLHLMSIDFGRQLHLGTIMVGAASRRYWALIRPRTHSVDSDGVL